MVHYTLHYFDLYGRAEPARMLFALAGVEFTDRRWSFAEWPEVKKEPIFKFGKAPILEVDGEILPESLAIYRYLAGKFGFAGETDFDKALVDSQLDYITIHHGEAFPADRSTTLSPNIFDHYQKVAPYYIVQAGYAEGNKEELQHSVLEPARDEYFSTLSKWIENNESKSGFLVGPNITIADLVAFNHCLIFGKFCPGYYDNFPKIKDLVEKISEIPEMKKYLSERKESHI